VEFALVLPMLLVLFLGVADFGRAFTAGIVTEAATRDAAEIVANDGRMARLKDAACDATCRANLYDDLHSLAAKVACNEVRGLPPTTDATGGECSGLLVVGTCIHDALTSAPGDACSGPPSGTVIPSGCDRVNGPYSNAQSGPDGIDSTGAALPRLRMVEVRLCYRFTPLVHAIGLPIVSYVVPDVYFVRERMFTVSQDY
jgi:hypothetical protein